MVFDQQPREVRLGNIFFLATGRSEHIVSCWRIQLENGRDVWLKVPVVGWKPGKLWSTSVSRSLQFKKKKLKVAVIVIFMKAKSNDVKTM